MFIVTNEEEQEIKARIREYRENMEIGFDKISLQLYEYTYQLAYPVFRTEENSKHVTEHILKRLEQRIDDVDLEGTFYVWYAEFCAYRMYRIVSNRKGDIFHKDKYGRSYQHNDINDDPEFKKAAIAYLVKSESDEEDSFIQHTEGHHKSSQHNMGSKKHVHLHIAQRLLLVMYSVMELSVDQIADACEVKKSVIYGELASAYAALMNGSDDKEEPGLIDLLFPKLTKKVRLVIDLVASAVLIVFAMLFVL